MTKPLLAILLLLPLSVSAGELDGKAISCNPPPEYTDHQHFEFEAGTVERWRILKDETTAVLKKIQYCLVRCVPEQNHMGNGRSRMVAQ